MIEPHTLGDLALRLGPPSLEQFAHRRGEAARLLVHWGCGCTGIGAPAESDETTLVRWSRCDHHAAAEAALA